MKENWRCQPQILMECHFRIPTDDLIRRHYRNSHSKVFQLPSASIDVVSFPRPSGTGMTSLTLCFPPLKCQMIVCPSSLHLCVLGTNFSPIQTPSEIMSFGVSPVKYSIQIQSFGVSRMCFHCFVDS